MTQSLTLRRIVLSVLAKRGTKEEGVGLPKE